MGANAQLMNGSPTRVLLIENNVADSELVEQALASAIGHPFHLETVSLLASGLERLGREKFQVVLLDLALPDGQDLEAFDQVFLAAPNALILILCSASDESAARQAVQRGADDYLVKGHVDAHWLSRALYYLLERKEIREALRTSEARFRAISDASPLGIVEVLNSSASVDGAIRSLIAAANAAGGPDNITVVVMQFSGT